VGRRALELRTSAVLKPGELCSGSSSNPKRGAVEAVLSGVSHRNMIVVDAVDSKHLTQVDVKRL